MVALTRDIFTILAAMTKQGKFDSHTKACGVKNHSLVSITERENTRETTLSVKLIYPVHTSTF